MDHLNNIVLKYKFFQTHHDWVLLIFSNCPVILWLLIIATLHVGHINWCSVWALACNIGYFYIDWEKNHVLIFFRFFEGLFCVSICALLMGIKIAAASYVPFSWESFCILLYLIWTKHFFIYIAKLSLNFNFNFCWD